MLKTNRFGILLQKTVNGEVRWQLIPWHSIESINAFHDKICIDLADRCEWVDSPAPAEQLEYIFESRGADVAADTLASCVSMVSGDPVFRVRQYS